MNLNQIIEKTEDSNPDVLNRRKQDFETNIGTVTCFIHFHGSRTSAKNWKRVDFYLDNKKTSREDLAKWLN